jgi:hypothetical protein
LDFRAGETAINIGCRGKSLRELQPFFIREVGKGTMPETLGYQARNSAIYYTPPVRIRVGRTVVGFMVAAAAAVVGAVLYAKLQPALGGVYLRLGQVFAGAVAVGLLGMVPVSYGKVRIPVVAAFIGAAISLIALYSMWVTWIHDTVIIGVPIGYGTLIQHPMLLVRLIHAVNHFGAWQWHGERVRGIPLTIFWLGESGAMLACGVLLPLKAMADEDPVCTSCGAKCKLVRPIGRFAAEHQDELTATVVNRDFDAISRLTPPQGDSEPQLSLRLMWCPRCRETNVATVNHIRWITTQRGRNMVIRPLVNQLLLPAEDAARLHEILTRFIEGKVAGEKIPEIDSSADVDRDMAAAETTEPGPPIGNDYLRQATEGSASSDSDAATS